MQTSAGYARCVPRSCGRARQQGCQPGACQGARPVARSRVGAPPRGRELKAKSRRRAVTGPSAAKAPRPAADGHQVIDEVPRAPTRRTASPKAPKPMGGRWAPKRQPPLRAESRASPCGTDEHAHSRRASGRPRPVAPQPPQPPAPPGPHPSERRPARARASQVVSGGTRSRPQHPHAAEPIAQITCAECRPKAGSPREHDGPPVERVARSKRREAANPRAKPPSAFFVCWIPACFGRGRDRDGAERL